MSTEVPETEAAAQERDVLVAEEESVPHPPAEADDEPAGEHAHEPESAHEPEHADESEHAGTRERHFKETIRKPHNNYSP